MDFLKLRRWNLQSKRIPLCLSPTLGKSGFAESDLNFSRKSYYWYGYFIFKNKIWICTVALFLLIHGLYVNIRSFMEKSQSDFSEPFSPSVWPLGQTHIFFAHPSEFFYIPPRYLICIKNLETKQNWTRPWPQITS